jgi:hypothetical protein
MKTFVQTRYLGEFFSGREMFQATFFEKIKTHFLFNNFFSENRDANEITWDNMAESDRPQMTIWQSQTGHR